MNDYTVLADEYYDPRAHPTCANFRTLSRAYLAPWLAPGGHGLEVGAGDSLAAEILAAQGHGLAGLHITDVSAPMLEHSRRWAARGATLALADATALAAPDRPFDWLVASLADPYNLPAFWHGVQRVLRPDGLALVTLPSYEWAARFRRAGDAPELGAAEFVLRSGAAVRVPSVLRPLDEQVRLMQDAGLSVIDFRSLGAEALAGAPVSPKLDVFGGRRPSLVWGLAAARR